MRKIYSALAAMVFCTASWGQDPVSDAMPFMQLEFSPVSLSMGGTQLATSALVPLSDKTLRAGVSYLNYMPELDGTQYVGLGVAGRLNRLGLSLGFARGKGAEISGEKYSPAEILLNAGAGYAFTENLSAGVNLKYGREQILPDYSHGAVAADIFLAGRFGGFDFAGGVSSVGQKVKSESTGDFKLPAAANLSFGYTVGEEHILNFRARGDYYFSGALAAGIGFEYSYAGVVALRAGYHYGADSIIPDYMSLGAGLHFGEFCLDAAYLLGGDVLKNTLAVCAGVRF